MFKQIQNSVWEFLKSASLRALAFAVILIVGLLIIRLSKTLLRRALKKSKRIDPTLAGFIEAGVRFLLWLLLIFALAYTIKIPLTPLVTVLGAVGLAFSLAVKDSLANLANGLVLLGTKPFKVGDYVEIDEVGGTVRAVHLMTTELVTFDNKKILLPNGRVTTAAVVNFTAEKTRRVAWDLPVAYGTDTECLRKTVLALLSSHPKIHAVPPPALRFNGYGESALLFSARAWVAEHDFWDVFWEIGERLDDAFVKNGIVVPFRQVDVSIKQAVAKPPVCPQEDSHTNDD